MRELLTATYFFNIMAKATLLLNVASLIADGTVGNVTKQLLFDLDFFEKATSARRAPRHDNTPRKKRRGRRRPPRGEGDEPGPVRWTAARPIVAGRAPDPGRFTAENERYWRSEPYNRRPRAGPESRD